ncbi:MAG: hypothetical protein FJX23_08220 [Alphaproteobacteria bacterium]|nr:hypothetical protein [Alphaproteobacteria bacterium]
MRLALCLAIVMIASPAFAADKESLVKKVPNSKTRSVVVGKTPVFNIPEKPKAAERLQDKANTIKSQRGDKKGTILNTQRPKKDGWGNTLPTPKEEAADFLVRKNARTITR